MYSSVDMLPSFKAPSASVMGSLICCLAAEEAMTGAELPLRRAAIPIRSPPGCDTEVDFCTQCCWSTALAANCPSRRSEARTLEGRVHSPHGLCGGSVVCLRASVARRLEIGEDCKAELQSLDLASPAPVRKALVFPTNFRVLWPSVSFRRGRLSTSFASVEAESSPHPALCTCAVRVGCGMACEPGCTCFHSMPSPDTICRPSSTISC